jgi:membrane fusion protein (multidrug efflux system)
VAGFLKEVSYTEGTMVKKGQLLFIIDPQEYQAAANRARAQLAESRARHDRAVIQVNRLKPLAAQNAVSQQDLDNAIANEAATSADVDAAKAQFTTASLDLGYTRVTSPINGMAGKRKADVGAYVGSPDPTVLTTVSAIDSMRVDFTVSEAEYLQYSRAVTAEGRAGQGLTGLELILADGTTHDQKGHVTVVDRGIDRETGTLPIQAVFPNPSGLLRPGQFGRVRLPLTVRKGAILVPQRAVQELQGGYSVFVVGHDSTVKTQAVTVGARIGTDWVITTGLESTDRIVVEGVQKVRSGMKVNPKVAAPAPKPAATDSTER